MTKPVPETIKMKEDLLDMVAYFLYMGVPFGIVRAKNYVRVDTDTHEIIFKNNGQMIDCNVLINQKK